MVAACQIGIKLVDPRHTGATKVGVPEPGFGEVFFFQSVSLDTTELSMIRYDGCSILAACIEKHLFKQKRTQRNCLSCTRE